MPRCSYHTGCPHIRWISVQGRLHFVTKSFAYITWRFFMRSINAREKGYSRNVVFKSITSLRQLQYVYVVCRLDAGKLCHYPMRVKGSYSARYSVLSKPQFCMTAHTVRFGIIFRLLCTMVPQCLFGTSTLGSWNACVAYMRVSVGLQNNGSLCVTYVMWVLRGCYIQIQYCSFVETSVALFARSIRVKLVCARYCARLNSYTFILYMSGSCAWDRTKNQLNERKR